GAVLAAQHLAARPRDQRLDLGPVRIGHPLPEGGSGEDDGQSNRGEHVRKCSLERFQGEGHPPPDLPPPADGRWEEPGPSPAVRPDSQISRSAWAERSMMNLKRCSTSLPMRSVRILSVSTASCTVTLSRRRLPGSSVVTLSCSGCISPRPLKRMISGLAFLGSVATMRSRSASSSAQNVSLPWSTRNSGGWAR